jgi:hypothetical protein
MGLSDERNTGRESGRGGRGEREREKERRDRERRERKREREKAQHCSNSCAAPKCG